MEDKDVQKELTSVQIKSAKGNQRCDVSWKDKYADCRLTPADPGSYTVKHRLYIPHIMIL